VRFPIDNAEEFYEYIEEIYCSDKNISARFSRRTIFDFIEKDLIRQKMNKVEYTCEMGESLFSHQHGISPCFVNITAPISGVRLDDSARDFSLSAFKFGYLQDLEIPISGESDLDDGLYIQTAIDNVYDKTLAIAKAENAFLDFARLIVFISGKNDNSIRINTGLPLRPSVSREKMYVNTDSYQITDKQGRLEQCKIENKYLEKIPVNNSFFVSHQQLNKLWRLYNNKHRGDKLTDIELRIINSVLAVGESIMNTNIKNSVIYTCIALEILFSYDEGSMFQKSIADRIADTFVFILNSR